MEGSVAVLLDLQSNKANGKGSTLAKQTSQPNRPRLTKSTSKRAKLSPQTTTPPRPQTCFHRTCNTYPGNISQGQG